MAGTLSPKQIAMRYLYNDLKDVNFDTFPDEKLIAISGNPNVKTEVITKAKEFIMKEVEKLRDRAKELIIED